MTSVVSGKPWLVRRGVVQGGWDAPRHIYGRHPRTAVGLSRDRSKLLLVVADGRRPGVPGVRGDVLAALMAEFGAHDALNLDGGGSSELFIRAEGGVQNRPSDGRPRDVSSHLGIRVRPRARWFAAHVEHIHAPATLRAGETSMLRLRARNTGRAPWPAGTVLTTADDRPSAFYDVAGWPGTRVAAALPREVAPAESVDLTVSLAAPALTGRVHTSLQLRARNDVVEGSAIDFVTSIDAAMLVASAPSPPVSPLAARATSPASAAAPPIATATVFASTPRLLDPVWLLGVALTLGAATLTTRLVGAHARRRARNRRVLRRS